MNDENQLSIQNSTFEAIKERRAARRFSTAPIPDSLLLELLNLANLAPSGFNLQPWHFVVVRNNDLKRILKHVAMGQAQVLEAPAVVVFLADPECWKTSYPEVIAQGLVSKRMGEAQVSLYRKSVRLLFRNGPFGLMGLAKRLALPVRRLFKPTPTVITSAKEAEQYVRAQTMLAASTFMIAAQSAGLITCPMEGFDEYRLKRLLAIPRRFTIPLIVPIGYPLDSHMAAEYKALPVRLPLERKVSLDLFPNRLKGSGPNPLTKS